MSTMIDKQNKFLAMWDCEGLECLFDITDLEHDAMVAGLKGEEFKTPFNISMMMLRARANSQRSYEIYSFVTDHSIDYEYVKDMFKHSPQTMVNLIREKGNKIYSDRKTNAPVIV